MLDFLFTTLSRYFISVLFTTSIGAVTLFWLVSKKGCVPYSEKTKTQPK